MPTMSLKPTLQDREDTEWVSAGGDSKGKVGGSVLDARERLVDGECARHMFGSLFLQVVVTHAVDNGEDTSVSGW